MFNQPENKHEKQKVPQKQEGKSAATEEEVGKNKPCLVIKKEAGNKETNVKQGLTDDTLNATEQKIDEKKEGIKEHENSEKAKKIELNSGKDIILSSQEVRSGKLINLNTDCDLIYQFFS